MTVPAGGVILPGAPDKVARAAKILARVFGKPRVYKVDPVDELVLTIISQNTNDGNRDRAFTALKARFSTWEQVRRAKPGEVAEAIRVAGLHVQKAANIQSALRWMTQTFGAITLDPLRRMSDAEAIDLLVSQKGIGTKTAAVLMAFSFGRDLCPVDTHVHRIAIRLGWVKENSSAEATFWALAGAIPRGQAVSLHINLLKFGRTRCTARHPRCQGCPLWSDCIWAGKGSP